MAGYPSPPTVQLLGSNAVFDGVLGLIVGAEPVELDRPLPVDMILLNEPYAVAFPFPDPAVDPALLPPASLSLLDDASATVVNVLSKPAVLTTNPL